MTIASFEGQCRARAIASSDRDGLLRFYAGLSPDSLEARFHGAMPGIADRTATFFCGPDHEHREGLIAECRDARGEATIVGHVCLEPTGSGGVEIAIAIADRWQHHGLGRTMLARAIAWAQAHGVVELRASVRWSNAAMLGLIRSSGLPVTVESDAGGEVDAIIDLRTPVPHAA
jgi:GNAT superfamily N-acetyltransferase